MATGEHGVDAHGSACQSARDRDWKCVGKVCAGPRTGTPPEDHRLLPVCENLPGETSRISGSGGSGTSKLMVGRS